MNRVNNTRIRNIRRYLKRCLNRPKAGVWIQNIIRYIEHCTNSHSTIHTASIRTNSDVIATTTCPLTSFSYRLGCKIVLDNILSLNRAIENREDSSCFTL